MGFLFSVNVYVFIPKVLFLWLKIVKNRYAYEQGFYLVLMYIIYQHGAFLWLKIVKNIQKWVYMGMGDYLFVFIPMKKFLYGVNVYVFIPMVLFYC